MRSTVSIESDARRCEMGMEHGGVVARFKLRLEKDDVQLVGNSPADTLINGVNARGDIVGFFSDGSKVHGFARLAPTHEEFGWRD